MNSLYQIILIFTFISFSKSLKIRSIIDLTYTLNSSDIPPTFPFHTKFSSNVTINGARADSSYGFEGFYSNEFTMAEHVGTHVDAPRHVGKSLRTVDKIPLNKLYRIPGITIDVSSQVESNPDYGVQIKDIGNWIELHGDIPDGSIIIFTTGWGKKVQNMVTYFGLDSDGKAHFPGISAEAAQWIVDYKNTSDSLLQGIIAIAIDSPSFDVANITTFPAHQILLPAGILGIENAANTEKLPPKNFTITMLPLKMQGGTASPIRLMAEINDVPSSMRASSSSAQISMLLMALCAFVFI